MDKKQLQQFCENTLVSHLEMEFLDLTADRLTLRMPVDKRTLQPMGYLHGGASLALLETAGSALSTTTVDLNKYDVFGMTVNANHIRPASSGYIYATAIFLHKGAKTQIVNVSIKNDKGDIICDGRITNIIIPK